MKTVEENEEGNEQDLLQNETPIDTIPYDSIEDDLEELKAQNTERLDLKCTLYKYSDFNRGKDKAQCGSWVNCIPEREEIGKTFGSGRYYLIVTIPSGTQQKRIIRNYVFKLHEHYDKIKKANDEKNLVTIGNNGVQVAQDPMQTMGSMMIMVKSFIEALSPLLGNKGNSGNSDMSGLFTQQMKFASDMQMQMMQQQMEFFKRMQKEMVSNMNNTTITEEITETEQPNFLQQIIPLIEQFAPMLLGSDNPMVKAALPLLKTNAIYKQAVENPDNMKKIIAYLDGTKGEEATNTILSTIGVSRT